MAKILAVLLCLVVIESSLALMCKRCATHGCSTLKDEACPKAEGDKETACLTYIYRDADKKEVIDRKCVIKDKGRDFECPSIPNTDTMHCDTCTEDYCNSAIRLGGSTVVGIGLVAVVLSRWL